MLEVDSFRIPKPLSNKARLVPGILTDFRVISASLTTKIALFERYGQSKRAVGGTGMLTCADFPASGRTSFSAVARRKSDHAPLMLAPAAPATWRSRQKCRRTSAALRHRGLRPSRQYPDRSGPVKNLHPMSQSLKESSTRGNEQMISVAL